MFVGLLFSQYLDSCLFLFTAPPGNIYQFLISCNRLRSVFLSKLSKNKCHHIAHQLSTSSSLGLMLLYTSAYQSCPGAMNGSDCLFLIKLSFPFAPPEKGRHPTSLTILGKVVRKLPLTCHLTWSHHCCRLLRSVC